MFADFKFVIILNNLSESGKANDFLFLSTACGRKMCVCRLKFRK